MKGFFSDDVNISFFELEDSGGYSLSGHHELKVQEQIATSTMFVQPDSSRFMENVAGISCGGFLCMLTS